MSKENHVSPIWLVPPRNGCLDVFASALEQHKKSPAALICEYNDSDAWPSVLNEMVKAAEDLLRFALPLMPAWETYEELEKFLAWVEGTTGDPSLTKDDMEKIVFWFAGDMLERCKSLLKSSIAKPSKAWSYFVYTTEGRSFWEPEPGLPNDPYAWGPLFSECEATVRHFLSKVDLLSETKRKETMLSLLSAWEDKTGAA